MILNIAVSLMTLAVVITCFILIDGPSELREVLSDLRTASGWCELLGACVAIFAPMLLLWL
jgi:hypothetical protein